LSADVAERQICASPIDALRRLIGGPMVPLTLEGIRRAMPDEPR
jgi:hypothetical protein